MFLHPPAGLHSISTTVNSITFQPIVTRNSPALTCVSQGGSCPVDETEVTKGHLRGQVIPVRVSDGQSVVRRTDARMTPVSLIDVKRQVYSIEVNIFCRDVPHHSYHLINNSVSKIEDENNLDHRRRRSGVGHLLSHPKF
jgi:hypothetical protein